MSWWKWSTTAASNATADPTINWAEGMSPSAVNDSARAEMAAAAKYFADQSGSTITSGSSTAYTMTTNGLFDSFSHLDKQMIAFTPHTTCGATVTLSVDGLGPRPLRISPGVDLQSGMLIQGTSYVATYNNSDGAFYLRGFYALPYAIPIGGLLPYVGATAPNSNFALPFGQAISRTTYATLFSLISTTFGAGDGTTTFNIPDLRGRFVAGLDNMGGSAASRITVAGGNFDGTVLGATGGAQNHTLTQAEMPSHTHTDIGHSHNFDSNSQGNNISTLNIVTPINTGVAASAGSGSTNATVGIHTGTANLTNTGGGGAHSILPPTVMLQFIVRVI